MKPSIKTLLCALAGLSIAACGGDTANSDAAKAANPNAVSPDVYRKRQQAFADSVLNVSTSVAKVVEKLGKGYAVGSVALRDTIAALAQTSNCYQKGRENDPYLAGTVSIFAHMAVIGVDLIQVQDKQWTSAAGDLVDACLNSAMKNWKLDMSFGKPAAYIVQVQFKMDSTAVTPKGTDSSAMKSPTKKVPAKKPR